MEKLDPRLLLTRQTLSTAPSLDDGARLDGVIAAPASEGSAETVNQLMVIVQFDGPVAPLEAAGLTVMARAGDTVTGRLNPDSLEALADVDSVVRIEGSYPVSLDLDVSVPEVRANQVNAAPGVGNPPRIYNGNGVIVGVIDTGCDFMHPNFLNGNNTRLVSLWDMTLTAQAGEAPPPGMTVGVEYSRAAIDAAIAAGTARATIRHRDSRDRGHGTHVASTAVGSGANLPGVAPGADLVVVATRFDTASLTLAVSYILDVADRLDRPCVINMSLGSNAGPHDGTTAFERFIDRRLGTPGRAIVTSAGNTANDNAHWGDSIAAGTTLDLALDIAGNPRSGFVDIWYPQTGNLSVTLIAPDGTTTGPHAQPAASGTFPPVATPFVTGTGTQGGIAYNISVPQNRKNQLFIVVQNGATGVDTGRWRVRLTNSGASAVAFHAWTPGNQAMQFNGATDPMALTIGMPGTAREVIAVGSYITKPAGSAGPISAFSSRGPTADGRTKPDLSAPGEVITAALSQDAIGATAVGPGGNFQNMQGTSMAAPHVAGAVACLLEARPTLLQEQVRQALVGTVRTDSHTGTGNAVPNDDYGAGKLDVRALLEADVQALASRTWVRIRSAFFNWTEADTPPIFEIASNENGRAVIELAFGSRDIPDALTRDPADPLRYYHTAEQLDNVALTRADGTAVTLSLPEQDIVLTGNHAAWQMPQPLWDAYRQELLKSRATPPTSGIDGGLYYRVRFEPTGGTSAIAWPADETFGSPLNNRMGIIPIGSDPATQVRPDQAAIDAMPRSKDLLEAMWDHLPEADADRQSLQRIFTHRLFTNSIEETVRGRILTLWIEAGPARQQLFQLLERMFRTAAGLEMTVLKQPCLVDRRMMVDHLLDLRGLWPHSDIGSARGSEQVVEDILREIFDPNGQMNQGRAQTCAPTGIQTLLINENASEYVRLARGLLSQEGKATMANGDELSIPPGIFRATNYSGDQARPFFVRTNSELAFQASVLKYALGSDFPDYNPSAPPDDPDGVNTVFQTTLATGLSFAQVKRALDALFGESFQMVVEAAPSASLRNGFVQRMDQSQAPVLTVLKWGTSGLHAVVSLRMEAGRVFFKNPQYAGTRPPAGHQSMGQADAPPRRTDDPTQALESMGDGDLAGWLRGYYHRP